MKKPSVFFCVFFSFLLFHGAHIFLEHVAALFIIVKLSPTGAGRREQDSFSAPRAGGTRRDRFLQIFTVVTR